MSLIIKDCNTNDNGDNVINDSQSELSKRSISSYSLNGFAVLFQLNDIKSYSNNQLIN